MLISGKSTLTHLRGVFFTKWVINLLWCHNILEFYGILVGWNNYGDKWQLQYLCMGVSWWLCISLFWPRSETYVHPYKKKAYSVWIFFDCRCFHFKDNTYSNAVEVTKSHFRAKEQNLSARNICQIHVDWAKILCFSGICLKKV